VWVRLLFVTLPLLALSLSALADDAPAQAGDAAPSPAARDAAGRPPPEARPQFVLFCFDATPVWGKRFEDNNVVNLLLKGREARPADFEGPDPTITVFINTGFLQLNKWWKPKKGTDAWEKGPDYYKPYRAHPRLPGTKVLHYAKSIAFIEESARRLKKLDAMGVEIASHGVMHLDGGAWTRRQWEKEFDEHQRVLDLLELPAPKGYRAPFLATGSIGTAATLREPVFRVLKARGFRYDSSKTYTRGPRWPRKIRGTDIWEFPIETTFIDGEREIMFTDYGTDDPKKHFKASMREFNKRYQGDRAPIIFGGHGEHMKSNLKLFKKVCYLPDVRCATFSEVVAYMDAHPELSGYHGKKKRRSKKTKKRRRKRRKSKAQAAAPSDPGPPPAD
jgi:peptidoglycan/xylan/chitin deacetylase (PgdA/CDA1 family)